MESRSAPHIFARSEGRAQAQQIGPSWMARCRSFIAENLPRFVQQTYETKNHNRITWLGLLRKS